MLCGRQILLTSLYKYYSHKVNPSLICFKDWTSEMVTEVLKSSTNLKEAIKSSGKTLDLLKDSTVTMIFELNEPLLKLAVSQGVHILGGRASDTTDKIMFDQEYMGRLFSTLTDMLFVSSRTHGCVRKFAAAASVPVVCVRSRVHQTLQALATIMVFSTLTDMLFVSSRTHGCVRKFAAAASVPVVCVRSRVHQTLQALATIMAVQEEYKQLMGVRIAYVGRPAQVLNSYLLLCPMLGIHLNFMCCCKEKPVHPVLFKAGTDMCEKSGTEVVECSEKDITLKDVQVVISGPTSNPGKPTRDTFNLNVEEIEKNSKKWIFIHTCPKGPEVSDELFYHENARTLEVIRNMSYVAAALMANSIKSHQF